MLLESTFRHSDMKVNLERAIKNINDDILFLQPLCEAIVNAFQAHADTIGITFEKDTDNLLIGYTVKDNGDGFTDDNIESFLTLWSNSKIRIGGLGSGRVLCLKVFDDITIDSQTKDTNSKMGQKVKINFNKNFNKNNVEEIERISSNSNTSWTSSQYANINKNYMEFLIKCDNKKGQEHKGNINRSSEIKKIKEKIFINLLPLFIWLRDKKIQFRISFDDNNEIIDEKILQELFDNDGFKVDSFVIEKNVEDINIKETFILTYQIKKSEEKDSLEQFYGASDRKVTKFPNDTGLLSLPEGYSGIFCLTSNYFNDKVKDSRTDFIIKADQNNVSLETPIVFHEINEKLRNLLSNIIKTEFPELEENFKKEKNKLCEEYPYLIDYIDEYTQITMPIKDLLDKARTNFYKKREQTEEKIKKFINSIKNDNFNKDKYEEIKNQFTSVGKEQLASYMAYRQTIIDMLMNISQKTKLDKKAFDEGDIHDLFLERGKSSTNIDNRYANNIWIFDDKFMSYIYVASDKTIQSIAKEIQGDDFSSDKIKDYHKGKEPDLLMFFSEDEDNYRDVLLIEFKRLYENIDAKMKAINQLRRYPVYIRKVLEGQNIRSIFTYTIIDLDEETREALVEAEEFDPYAFGDKENNVSSYYYYAKNSKAHINVLSFDQLLVEADARNQVFLNILRNKIR
ncbi:MAG: ATP-binding protein [Campylobacteraceae bacterium]|jgi:hypothetical protein|nr:ATP-binding protein [Campylobacteraceae bacterium]